jgi:hypothetical protein
MLPNLSPLFLPMPAVQSVGSIGCSFRTPWDLSPRAPAFAAETSMLSQGAKGIPSKNYVGCCGARGNGHLRRSLCGIETESHRKPMEGCSPYLGRWMERARKRKGKRALWCRRQAKGQGPSRRMGGPRGGCVARTRGLEHVSYKMELKADLGQNDYLTRETVRAHAVVD